MAIAIDVRMMWSSGIGVYIRQVVSRVIDRYPEMPFYLLGKERDRESWEGFRKPNVRWAPLATRIFTLLEQFSVPLNIPRQTRLFWSPHYNIPLLYRGKLLVTVHDVLHLAMESQIKGIHRRLYARTMFRRLGRQADGIICVSKTTRDELMKWSPTDPAKLEVVYNGIEDSWFNIQKGERPHRRPYLLFVGNVKPHKNLLGLLQAFDSLKNLIPHDLVIVGKKEGFIIEDLKTPKAAEKLGDRVRFTGLVDDNLLKQFYVHAELLVFPSLYEGFGFPPLEAMACGCPTAVSRAASLPEICGDATRYFDPRSWEEMAKTILEVVQNRESRLSFVEKGRGQARLFSWEKCAQETCQVIDRLIR